MNNSFFNRRGFLKRTALSAGVLAFPFVARRNVYGANSRLNLAAVGVGGKGEVDIRCCSTENIVALCEVDQERGAATFRRYPDARRFTDYRVLFDEMEDSIDAVIVSTPDHTHAQPALRAILQKKHVYLQKPMAHTVYEARILTNMAAASGVVTQMGNQGHSLPDTRRLVELIQADVLGDVEEVHAWTDRPTWPQGIHAPVDYTPVPESLEWDMWLGPANGRPYSAEYLPFKWRGFWDFGTGALGDMGCHTLDLAFWSLKLRDPKTIKVIEQTGMTNDSPPTSSVIEWEFPRIKWEFPKPGRRDAVTLTWYDGGRKPDPKLAGKAELPPNGSIFVGSKDTLFVPSYWGAGEFLSGATMADFKDVRQSIARFPGAEQDNDLAQHQEWIQAIKGNGEALSNFNHSGPMTEAVLLGNVALRTGKRIRWDARTMRIVNDKNANEYLTKEYRKGWELPLVR